MKLHIFYFYSALILALSCKEDRSFFRLIEPSYPFGPFYGSSSSAHYEFILPPDHDEYDMDYFYPGNSFEYDTYSNYHQYDSVNNSDDEGLFVY